MKKEKKPVNKKILLGFASLLACIGIIVISSFFPFIIDPSKFLTKEFLTREIIIIAIVIVSMISSIFIGQAGNGSNPNSNIAKARVKFNESVSKITNISTFFQWIRRVQQPEDIALIKERKMREIGITNFAVIDLDIKEINSLIDTPQKIDGRYYKAITKEQAKDLIYIKTKLKINLVEPNYYLTCKSNDTDRTITEKAGNESRKKSSMIVISVLSKSVMTLVIAIVFTSFVYDASSVLSQAQAWADFLSRMSAVISSSFMGYMVGSQINDIDADYIEMRVLIHKKFLEDKDFKPLTQEEEAKEQFSERVKKENQILMLGGNDDERGQEKESTNILD